MKKITIKLMFETIEGLVVRDDSHQWILKDVTIKGLKQVRTFEGYSVPKNMALNYKMSV